MKKFLPILILLLLCFSVVSAQTYTIKKGDTCDDPCTGTDFPVEAGCKECGIVVSPSSTVYYTICRTEAVDYKLYADCDSYPSCGSNEVEAAKGKHTSPGRTSVTFCKKTIECKTSADCGPGEYCIAGECKTLAELFPGWMVLLAIAFAIGFGLAAIAYMLSSVFRVPTLSVWAKTEFAEMVGTVFLVAIILIGIGLADSVFIAATGQRPLDTSVGFTTDLTDKLLGIYFDGMVLNIGLGFLASAPIQYKGADTPTVKSGEEQTADKDDKSPAGKGKYAGITIPPPPASSFYTLYFGDINFYPYYGTNIFTKQIMSVQSLVLTAVVITVILNLVASLVNEFAIPVLLPLGVFFCCFALTRKMGRLFIAFAVCLYFFVPVAIIMSKTMYESFDHDAFPRPDLTIMGITVDQSKADDIVKPFFGPGYRLKECSCKGLGWIDKAVCLVMYFVCIIFALLLWILDLVIALINLIGFIAAALAPGRITKVPVARFLILMYMNEFVMVDMVKIVGNYIPYTLSYAVPVILMPVIFAVVVVTAIRSISPAIGGEAQITGIAGLI